LQKEAALLGRDAAVARYENEIEVTYAKAARDVAQAELDKMREAVRTAPGSISDVEIRRTRLEVTRADLQIQKAIHDQALAKFDADAKGAELKAAELGIERRTVLAPFDGVIVSLLRRQGEWVDPGDPILQVIRLNTMRVETRIDQSKFDPHEIAGRDVTVTVELARGRKAEFPGRITFVSPRLDGSGRFPIRAEVFNRRDEAGQWMLRDGHNVTMKIHLGAPRTNFE
jgi:macrolide-specific efflux system membrane fusion protein